jgi:predicted DNA-binding protein with PD1-like motif
MHSNVLRAHAFRLVPGDDLYDKLKEYVVTNGIKAATIQTCVGSLKEVKLRLANTVSRLHVVECHEICSLVGTIGTNGCIHLHISLSDKEGKMIGGHVVSGCKIYTTAEIVLLELVELEFIRPHDERTGFDELVVKHAE